MDHVQQLRNLKDFLLVYNRMTEICFQRCTTNFNYRALTMDEERCVDSCAGKLIRSNHRLMGTYVQLMPGMVQRRMEEMEKKAAELDKAEAQAAASTEAPVPAVPTVPELAPAATDTPVGLVPPDVTVPVLPDVTVPVLATDAQPAVFVSDATDAVPHLPAIVIPAADVPVANGPSLTEGAGNGAPPFVLPPILAPELPGPVGSVPSVAEPSSAEAKLAAPIALEGPIAPISAPLISSIPLPELSLGSSEEKIPSPVALPSTPPAPAAVSVTVPLTDFSTSVPDVVKFSSDAPAPGVSALPVPILLSDSAPGISATTVPIPSSDTAPGISATTVPIPLSDSAPGVSAVPVPIPSSDSAPGSQSSS